MRITHENHPSNEKTLVHCCIEGIILPSYTGIKITHYKLRNPINQHVIGVLDVAHQDLPKYAVIGEYSGEVKDYVRSPKKDWTIGAACCWVSTINEKNGRITAYVFITHKYIYIYRYLHCIMTCTCYVIHSFCPFSRLVAT